MFTIKYNMSCSAYSETTMKKKKNKGKRVAVNRTERSTVMIRGTQAGARSQINSHKKNELHFTLPRNALYNLLAS